MILPYYQVDAFASQRFTGNPAGVCVLASFLPDALMQSIAAENNLSETAFVVPLNDGYALRWFTPTVEVDLCGHATLAAAHVLHRHLGAPGERLTFHTRSGALPVAFRGEDLELDFPACPAQPVDTPPDLVEGLGVPLQAVGRATDYLAVVASAAVVRDLRPDLMRLARLDGRGVIVTAPGEEVDFVSRFFAPRVGVPEDPVTGSAHCTLAPYWAGRLGRTRLSARQLSARGGNLSCEVRGDRVAIAGRAVTYSTGFLHLE